MLDKSSKHRARTQKLASALKQNMARRKAAARASEAAAEANPRPQPGAEAAGDAPVSKRA